MITTGLLNFNNLDFSGPERVFPPWPRNINTKIATQHKHLNPPVHDGLEDGGEGGDPDAGADKDGVLCMEDLTGGGSEGTVDEDVERFVDLADVDIILVTSLATSSVEVVGAVFLSDPVEDEVVGGAEISFIFLHNCF